MLVSVRVIEDNCLLVFVLWRDKPRVFMRMHGDTISLKGQLTWFISNRSICTYNGLITVCKHARMVKCYPHIT